MDHRGFGERRWTGLHVDSAKDFPMEPEGTDTIIDGFQRETAAKAVEAIPSFGNILLFHE